MNTKIQIQLSVMMFIQFFVWGCWYATIAFYMTAQGMEDLTHWPYTVNPIAAIVAPFFLGLVADRYFATEKVLGVLHLVGGVFMLLVPQATGNPVLFITLMLLYNLCFMPTLGLSNTLSFHNMEDQEKQFPKIRVWGTIGWIVAGLFISYVLGAFVPEGVQAEATNLPVISSGISSLILGLYCFTLPHTPPKGAGEQISIETIIGLDALRHLGSRPFYIFIISSLLICIPLAAYYNFTQLFLGATGFEDIAATQTLGQMSEIFFMLLIPFFFIRYGVKWMLIIGMGAWALRYVLFAFAAPETVTWMILLGIILHGICYDFFFVTGQIYVDKRSTPALRGQAQGFLVLVTYGIGMLIGAQVAGWIYNGFLAEAPAIMQQAADGSTVEVRSLTLEQWKSFWLVPAALAAGIMLFFAFTFREEKETVS